MLRSPHLLLSDACHGCDENVPCTAQLVGQVPQTPRVLRLHLLTHFQFALDDIAVNRDRYIDNFVDILPLYLELDVSINAPGTGQQIVQHCQ